MSDIKNISNPGINISELQNNQAQDSARSGSFQGANVNAVRPPTESPLAADAQKLNVSRAVPPQESPLGIEGAQKGYRTTGTPASRSSAAPSDDQLFDYAVGKNKDAKVATFIAQDAATSKAVGAIERGNREIGAIDREPQLDEATNQRLDAIRKNLFSR